MKQRKRFRQKKRWLVGCLVFVFWWQVFLRAQAEPTDEGEAESSELSVSFCYSEPDRELSGVLYDRERIEMELFIEETDEDTAENIEESEREEAAWQLILYRDDQVLEDIEVLQETEQGKWTGIWILETDEMHTEDGCYQAEVRSTEKSYWSKKMILDSRPPRLSLAFALEEDSFTEAVNYREAGYLFADRLGELEFSGQEEGGGLAKFSFQISDMEGTVLKKEEKELFTESEEIRFEMLELVSLPSEAGEHFQGIIEAELTDLLGNTFQCKRQFLIEGEELHRENSRLELLPVTAPSRRVNGVDYYNTDVSLVLQIEDRPSGIAELSCSKEGEILLQEYYKEQAGSDFTLKPEKDLVFTYEGSLTLQTKPGNSDLVTVKAAYADHTGHREELTQSFRIDRTVPRVTIVYDEQEPVRDKYYRQIRTATITVWEQNFREEDVEFLLSHPEGVLPVIEPWVHEEGKGEDTRHTCKVVFGEDGTYQLGISVMDLAGNQTVCEKEEEFVIDQTDPKLSVHFDNLQSENGFYFSRPRTAFLDIAEENFDGSLIKIQVEEEKGGSIPKVSAFSWDGKRYRATIFFSEDGRYRFWVTGTDLADNAMEGYETELFVIDQSAPRLSISNLENHSANKGEIHPKINYWDENERADSLEIRMTGRKNGVLQVKARSERKEQGLEVEVADPAHIQRFDDLYTLEVRAYDLAGNYSIEQIEFSLNRFGSMYVLEAQTETLLEKDGIPYLTEAPRLVVQEINVDPLEFLEITSSQNGTLKTLERGRDYQVKEERNTYGWRSYRYQIEPENFQEDGWYTVTIYSEDRAHNASDNASKGKLLFFAVDKTAPDIQISGIEDGEKYREIEREITIDVQDNLCLKNVVTKLNGEVYSYTEEELRKTGGRLVLTAKSSRRWQKLSVSACDGAGNETVLAERKFLLNPEPVQEILPQTDTFPGVLFPAGVSLVLFICLGIAKMKKSKEKRRKNC